MLKFDEHFQHFWIFSSIAYTVDMWMKSPIRKMTCKPTRKLLALWLGFLFGTLFSEFSRCLQLWTKGNAQNVLIWLICWTHWDLVSISKVLDLTKKFLWSSVCYVSAIYQSVEAEAFSAERNNNNSKILMHLREKLLQYHKKIKVADTPYSGSY